MQRSENAKVQWSESEKILFFKQKRKRTVIIFRFDLHSIQIMEPEEPLIQGILLFPPQGMLGQLKKTWHKRYCQLFNASKYGIERLEIYDNQDEAVLHQHSPRIITLEACVKIAPSNQSHVFTVVTKSGVHHFGCSSEADMTNWITAFQSVAFKDNISNQTIEEDNDLYCTSGHSVFSVKVVETIASKRCGLENKSYTLIVASADMKLMDGEVLLYTWPYRYIRKYGYRGGKFTFEAGRKCESGEGSFRLEHSNQQEIFRCIYTKMKSMKNTMTFLSCDKSPNIDCNDLQYHAAMSMEAGSRSPLPPSPNSSANLIDIDFSTISQNSQKHLNCSSSSLDSVSFIKPPPPIIKPKPTKPPRKHMITALLEKKSGESEFADLSACGKCRRLNSSTSPEQSTKSTWDSTSVEEDKHRYDLVEVRNAAWKTHGIDRVPHMERPKPLSSSNVSNDDEGDDESQYETMPHFTITSQASTKNKETLLEGITPISPIIHNNVSNSSDPPNYDKLQYFGSTHKLNHNPGYKTPNIQGSSQASQSNSNTTASIPVLESHPSWNDYDFIDNMSSIRLADDSHLGYGIIRKKTTPSAPSTSSTSADNAVRPIHKVYNETEYAIVSKPKKV